MSLVLTNVLLKSFVLDDLTNSFNKNNSPAGPVFYTSAETPPKPTPPNPTKVTTDGDQEELQNLFSLQEQDVFCGEPVPLCHLGRDLVDPGLLPRRGRRRERPRGAQAALGRTQNFILLILKD